MERATYARVTDTARLRSGLSRGAPDTAKNRAYDMNTDISGRYLKITCEDLAMLDGAGLNLVPVI